MHVPLYEDVEFINADNAVIVGVDVCVTVAKFGNVDVVNVVRLDEGVASGVDIDVFSDADGLAYWDPDVVAYSVEDADKDLFPLLYPNVAVFVLVLKVVVAVVSAVPYVDAVAFVSCACTNKQLLPDWQQYIPDWQSESRLHRTKTTIGMIIIVILIIII